jgi:signal-transduction protein with cAMP-binding, CBS, and nucleotidyltransferase domain
MNAASVKYELSFFVEDLNATVATQNEVFDLIHRHLASAGIALAAPAAQPFTAPESATRKSRSEAERLLEQISIFASLTTEERSALAPKLKRKRHESGEILLQPGTVLQSLFLIAAGVLSVARQDESSDLEVLRLGPGDHFGEIGLLTGTPSLATIKTMTSAIIYELPKADLAPLLEARPEVAQELSHELALRQAAGRTIAAAETVKIPSGRNLSDWFSERIRKLFDLDRV